MQAASPRPSRGLDVPARDWAEEPAVGVSVVVTCYNVESYAEGCLRSILDQNSDASFGVIAVDDGSTDRTGEILDGLAAQGARLRVIHQENRASSSARNRGIAECQGGGWRSWTPMTCCSQVPLKAAFAFACDLLEAGDPDEHYTTTKTVRWCDLERALRTRNYLLWKTVSTGI